MGFQVQYAVGIVADADGVVVKGGLATISTGFSIEVNNYKKYLEWLLENEPSSTALLPFQTGDTGRDGNKQEISERALSYIKSDK